MRLTNPNALPILLIIEGQSNALGSSNNPPVGASWLANAPNWWWKQGTEPFGSSAWVPNVVISSDSAHACMGITLQRRLVDEMDREVALVMVAEGSTDLYSSWAAPPNDGAKHLIQLLDTEVTAALADGACPIDPSQPYRTIFVRRQGEADAQVQLYADNYQSRLTDHYNWLEARPWCKNPYWFEYLLNIGCTGSYVGTVRTAQTNAVAARTNATLVNTDSYALLPDNLHYTAAQNMQLGVLQATRIMNRGL